METTKVVATLIANPGRTSKEIAALASAKPNTVETVLQRVRHALETEVAQPEPGKRGRPEMRYSVKSEWVPVLRERWALGRGARAPNQLETALSALEASSFAAIDPLEPPDERARMADLAKLQARAAYALARINGDAEMQSLVSERIRRAEARIAPPPPLVRRGTVSGVDFGVKASPEYLLFRWREWASRLAKLMARYECKATGAADRDLRGVALVLDLIPEAGDPVEAAILRVLDRIHKPTICVHVAALKQARQEQFLRDFEELALDPIARFADLYAAVDSSRLPSTETWAEIDSMARGKRADRIAEIAGASLRSALGAPGLRSEMIVGVSDFYAHFLRQVEAAKDISVAESSLWSVYGSPAVLDLHESEAFRDRVEGQNWSYLGSAASRDLESIARAEFSLII